jgi:hypothetical protein
MDELLIKPLTIPPDNLNTIARWLVIAIRAVQKRQPGDFH